MANSGGMAKDGIDNGWVFVGLKAIGKDQKSLAEILNVDPSQVTRLKKNDRTLAYAEGTAIKAWFKSFNYVPPQNGHESKEDLSGATYTSGQVAHSEAKEGVPMGDSELLRFMRTLIEDNKDLREKVRRLEGEPAPAKRKRRRHP